MELENTIARVKELIAKKEDIEAELQTIFAGTAPPRRKPSVCGVCQKEGHTARTCPDKPQE